MSWGSLWVYFFQELRALSRWSHLAIQSFLRFYATGLCWMLVCWGSDPWSSSSKFYQHFDAVGSFSTWLACRLPQNPRLRSSPSPRSWWPSWGRCETFCTERSPWCETPSCPSEFQMSQNKPAPGKLYDSVWTGFLVPHWQIDFSPTCWLTDLHIDIFML